MSIGNGYVGTGLLGGRGMTLEEKLLNRLGKLAGERGGSEGAVEALERIIRERDFLIKNEINRLLKPVNFSIPAGISSTQVRINNAQVNE